LAAMNDMILNIFSDKWIVNISFECKLFIFGC
jgi:hypothetical protein